MVALKLFGNGAGIPARFRKQERRGGIETPLKPHHRKYPYPGSRNAVVALKPEDIVHPPRGILRSRNAVVALKRWRRPRRHGR